MKNLFITKSSELSSDYIRLCRSFLGMGNQKWLRVQAIILGLNKRQLPISAVYGVE